MKVLISLKKCCTIFESEHDHKWDFRASGLEEDDKLIISMIIFCKLSFNQIIAPLGQQQMMSFEPGYGSEGGMPFNDPLEWHNKCLLTLGPQLDSSWTSLSKYFSPEDGWFSDQEGLNGGCRPAAQFHKNGFCPVRLDSWQLAWLTLASTPRPQA